MNQKMSKQEYDKIVQSKMPAKKVFTNCIKAFVVGGIICCIGQLVRNWLLNGGVGKDATAAWTSLTMIFLGAFLTGLGVYDKLGKFAGAGSIVPITGFANSMVSPAIEFKSEGQVFGIGSKMFVVAGPVIVFGLLASVLIGLIHYFIM